MIRRALLTYYQCRSWCAARFHPGAPCTCGFERGYKG